MRHQRVLGLVAALLTTICLAPDAFAQKIRSFGTQAEQTYGTSVDTSAVNQAQGQTGQTTAPQVNVPPAQEQAQQQQQPGAEGDAGQVQLEPSYVTVFNPGGAQAPLPVDLTPEKMYSGIIPGTRDEVSHLQRARERGQDFSNQNRLTWVGFHARDDVTRVFFQTAREAEYDVGEEGGAIVVTFRNTVVSAYNFRRFIDTTFFNRNVTRVDVERVNRDTVRARIQLRQYEQPDIDRSGNYLYLDFSGQAMEGANASASAASQ